MEKILEYIKKNEEHYLEELKESLRFESISADPSKKDEILKCANWFSERLERMGFENAKVISTDGAPGVYADWLHAGKDKPTVLVYGHYDVQPPDPLEKWKTPPFEPTIRDGYLYARGSSDDKGQLLTHLFALESLLKINGKLNVNVKIFIEGEEEGGTDGTANFVREHADFLSCDVVALSDTSWFSEALPTIVYALRGMCYLDVRIKGPNRDLHSGVYGGKVQNPLNAMARIIAGLQDEKGKIKIDGFYDDVLKLTDQERSEFKKVGDDDKDMMRDLELTALWGEEGFTSNERNWARPSIDVHGIWGGFSGEGAKTVIAAECGFKISSRLVPNQDPKKIAKLYEAYIKKIAPPGITVDVKALHGAKPVMFPTDSKYMKAALDAFEKGFHKRPVLVREGASIPLTETFLTALKAPSILLGFGLAGDNIHSPNERFKLGHFYRGIVTCFYFYHSL
ncbi:MAG: dipeptidase [Pseudomonadota bacterium]